MHMPLLQRRGMSYRTPRNPGLRVRQYPDQKTMTSRGSSFADSMPYPADGVKCLRALRASEKLFCGRKETPCSEN